MKYKSFHPGQPWLDTNGKRIHAHGGSIFYENGRYYWYGENKEKTTGLDSIWHWGIRCYVSGDLYNWDDLGVIIPLADAYYQSRHPEKICANEKLMTLTAYRMKKNLKWIAQKGMLCPAKLYMIKDMPTGMLAGVLSRVYQSEFGNKFLYRHAMHAPEEFQRLHQEFYNYMKTHTKESNKA